MKIWKFPLKVGSLQTINMPLNAQILHLASQSNQPNLWALVDENAGLECRNFATYGTGHPMPSLDYGQYVGSYTLDNGEFVFHVFEV